MQSLSHSYTKHQLCPTARASGSFHSQLIVRAQQPRQQLQPPIEEPQQQHGSNPVVTALVSAMTESLRLLGVGKRQYDSIAVQPSANAPLQAGMTGELVERLRGDFQRAYFVTGLIDDSIYDPNCTFVDPTVQFSGVNLWKRNLQLLVPFLVQPKITLYSTDTRQSSSPPEVEAEWQLATWLSLPWRPYVEIEGRTVYTLNSEGTQVVRHEEFWNVSPLAALSMMFRPGPPIPTSSQ